MSVSVVPVESSEERERFLRLPWRLYRTDPAWVPNLLLLQRETLDPKKNPFFDHAEVQLFLALKNGMPAGRISAQFDHLYNEYHNEKTGRSKPWNIACTPGSRSSSCRCSDLRMRASRSVD